MKNLWGGAMWLEKGVFTENVKLDFFLRKWLDWLDNI